MKTMPVGEFKAHFSEALAKVQHGEEIAISFGRKKEKVAVDMGFEILELDVDHVSSCHRLPRENRKDPFDRMLVWQAIRQNLVLVAKDKSLKDYKPHGLSLAWN